jgi:type IV pilus assembly protein PilY1
MNVNLIRHLIRWSASLLLGFALSAPTTATTLSISQTPLFITISLPSNITVLLDDSGSMAWGHVPDALGENGNAIVLTANSVTATAVFTTSAVIIGSLSHGKYPYSCSSGYTLNPSSPTSGSSSTAAGYTCQKVTSYNYSCPSGSTLSGPTSGSSSSPSTTTCSGSYQSETGIYIPDTNAYKSATFNPLAYDPTITYLPGYDNASNLLANASFTAAYCNPYNTSAGTVNLSTSYEVTVDYDPSTTCSSLQSSTDSEDTDPSTDETDNCDFFTSSGSCNNPAPAPMAAYYYKYVSTNTGCTASTSDDRCYTKITVSATSGPGSTDERTNFANWYSFYRTRNLTTNTSANRAFTGLGTGFRVAWRDLNTCTSFASTGCKGWSTTSYDNRIASFASTHRTTFFNWLAHFPAGSGTPLRTGLQSIGAYYQTTGVSSPYAFNPQVTDSPEYVCRPNYAVVMTDGLWNTDSITTFANADNTAITLPDGTAYPPASPATSHPYSDTSSNSLADIAFYYWSHSLRSDLGTSTALEYMPNTKAATIVDSSAHTVSVAPYWNPQNDPASWPHMVTFTVGLGMTSTITNPDWNGSTYATGTSGGYNNLVTGTTAWPAVSSNSTNNVYDLWHAALDSRGQFFSADTPQDVSAAFTSIVNRIQGRVGSSSAIAVNSTRLDSNTLIYQAQFNSASWTGEVLAFNINSDGSIGTTAWAASTLIPAANSRSIFTWDETANSGAGGGISFLWSSLNTAEKAYLNTNYSGTTDTLGSNRLSYLRGDQSNEETNSGVFRNRSQILGDIVDSNPEYVGGQDYGFDKVPGEGSSYDAYVATKQSRTTMLYVGANDGTMHALNASTGAEVFAYVPRGMYPNLSALTDPTYTHQFYIDGSATGIDAYVSSAWATLLVGSTGAGAREVFLMDVSSPSTFAGSKVLWDYDGTSKADNDMGYSLPQPTIARMNDGDWYVLFGNGYNSPNQHAVLYMYNIRTKVLKKFDTQVGSSTLNNGLSAPNPIDLNNDRVADVIYAGDLQGNLWKLDVSNSDNTKWGFTFGTTAAPKPLFTAKDSSNNVQSITDRPQIGLSSTGQVMVMFGTGTYFLTTDNTVPTTPPVQDVYGLIDDLGKNTADQVTRSNLLQQSIVAEKTISGNNYRITTGYALTAGQQGWYIDLLTPPTPGTAVGERVVSDAVIDNGRIIFTTLIPQGNACQFGGVSWLMELDLDNGGQLDMSPFDVDGNGKFNSNDYTQVTYTDPKTGHVVTVTVPVSGKQSTVGIIKTPGIIRGANEEYKFNSGSTGATMMTPESVENSAHRLSWQQLQ